jgi:hypothetical protein
MSSSADWSRVVNTTTKRFIKGETVNILRNRKLSALLKSKGRISFNWAGTKSQWQIRYRRAPMQGYADAEVLTFPRRDRWKQAEIDWRSYASTDSMTKGERLQNKSVAQLVSIYDTIGKAMVEDIKENFCDELYVDGRTAGNSKRIHGIESFMSQSGAAAGATVGTNSSSYAGLSNALANYGGSWGNGTWPIGSGDAHYDFWTPLLVNSQATAMPATTKDWANNAPHLVRFAIIYTQKNKTLDGKLDLFMMDGEWYRQFLTLLDDKERIQTQHNASNSALIKLGYTDVTNFDGVDLTYEFGVPVNTAYGINVNAVELRSQQGDLFVVEGPEYSMASKSWHFGIDFYGNTSWNPRQHCKIYPIG